MKQSLAAKLGAHALLTGFAFAILLPLYWWETKQASQYVMALTGLMTALAAALVVIAALYLTVRALRSRFSVEQVIKADCIGYGIAYGAWLFFATFMGWLR